MTKKNVKKGHRAGEYHEESSRPAIFATLVVVALIAAPLAWANLKIEEEGTQAADISEYTSLASQLTGKIVTLRTIIEQGVLEDAELENNTIEIRNVPFIIPDSIPTNVVAVVEDPNAMNFRMSGIYYNTHDPIVTIDGENMHEGETIKGFKILEIRKNSVIFRSPLGETVIKNFYEDYTE